MHVISTTGSFPRPSRPAPTTALAAAFLACTLVSSAHAQRTDPSPPYSELVRKVEAGEQENGFCATVNWPRRTDIADFQAYLEQSVQDSVFLARSDYGNTGGCSYYRIQSAFQQNGQRCVETLSWACFDKGVDAGRCAKVSRNWCRDGSGSWRIQR